MTAAKASAKEKEYDDIPGTFVFDADRSRRGYYLNMFCMSLMKADNRKAFKENEASYLDRFALTPEQREAILSRNYNRMLELGGNIYFTAKLGATDGHSFQHIAAIMTGSTQEDYAKMMLAGGRSVEGNRSRSGRDRAAQPAPRRVGAKSAARAGAKSAAKAGAKSAAKAAAKSAAKAGGKSSSRRAAKHGKKAGSKRG
jgi:protocatechuate 4,5-dioxygenase alpha chain